MKTRPKKKVLVIYGTRPEAVKVAPVVLGMRRHRRLKPVVLVTAQHRTMLDPINEFFGIKPDRDLGIMKKGQDLFYLTSRVVEKVGREIAHIKPDIVLTHGDTTTTMAASLAAFYHRVPIAHLEAGLRTHDKYRPFPEEVNRLLTDAIADICFAPTNGAKKNLRAEGIPSKRIHVTGNTVVDALKWSVRKLDRRRLAAEFPFLSAKKRLVLVTGHRRENFGEGMKNICAALSEIAARHEDVVIAYPVHLNPNVRKPVRAILAKEPRIHLIDPVGYPEFVYLMDRSYLILTDSGGLQEEAPSLSKPVLVMRDVTERPEAVKAGCAKLVGTDRKKIVRETRKLLTDAAAYKKMTGIKNPFGDGKAAARVVRILNEYLTD